MSVLVLDVINGVFMSSTVDRHSPNSHPTKHVSILQSPMNFFPLFFFLSDSTCTECNVETRMVAFFTSDDVIIK